MYPRQNVTEMFSTFAQLEENKLSKWVTDINLSRNIQSCLNSSSEVDSSENFWALYWYKSWQNNYNSIAKMHLAAYLQEPFYLASRIIAAKYTNNQYGIADYFQMANAELEIILINFNPKKSYKLRNYAVMTVFSRLKEILRQRKEVNICSNWLLLRQVSTKIFIEALSTAGLSPNTIAQHRLAWTCYKELYVYQPSGKNKSSEPNRQMWKGITDLYNRKRQTQLNFYTKSSTSKEIELWLTQAAIYIRAYLYPSLKSSNTLALKSQDVEILDIPELSSNSPLADMITKEGIQSREQQILLMSSAILDALHILDTESQEILRLYYQERLTQQQIMQFLQKSQSTVSRTLVKSRKTILAALIKWRQDLGLNLNNYVNSTSIEDISIALEQYLIKKYADSNVK